MKEIPPHLREIIDHIREVAVEFGLDFFETIFEMVDYKQMNEIAAFGGFPTRYPHWRFGMEYEQLSKSHEYGLSKIYEMVINNDPSYAYLLEGNNLVDQKTVIAHVYAHVDFFKNNYYFSKTNRRMVDDMANHGARIRRYVDRHGIEAVESFIDTCLSIDNLIDYYSPFIERRGPEPDMDELRTREVPKFKAKGYMDSFINPPEYIDEQKRRMAQEAEQAKIFPRRPERDVMLFLLENAPLESWEADILSIMREEAYYFAPQGQTKILNEGWACVAAETPVFTSRGLISMREVVEGGAIEVSDGENAREVYGRNIIADHATITIQTRRGYRLTGSNNHRILLSDGETWRRLDELAVGDEIRAAGGNNLWPEVPVALEFEPAQRISLGDVAEEAGVSLSTVIRYRNGQNIRREQSVSAALLAYDSPENQALKQSVNGREAVRIPSRLDEEFALFLGLLIGDGHISRVKRHFGLTTSDTCRVDRFSGLVQDLFELRPVVKREGNRWRILGHSETVSDFLEETIGLKTGASAAKKEVPQAILRSPKSVVAAFLRGLFDADGYAGEQGVILSTSSERLSEQVQLLLLNFGALSRRREQHDGCWHVHITGASAATFRAEVGFELLRKQRKLDHYLDSRQWFKKERWVDQILSIEEGREDVYDISVRSTHRYAAAGFINHNSFWHSRILTTRVLDDSEIIDFADINSRVMATAPGQLNPYKLGVALLRDIEDRWNKGKFGKEWEEIDDMERRDSWDKELGLGIEQIFRVRKLYNDVTFIDEFLTEEFAAQSKLFTYGYNRRSGHWEIESREFDEIKRRLLDSLTNFGQPFIYVRDANFRNRSELLLHHKFEGTELRVDYAREVLSALYRIWRRPVNLETKRDDKGILLGFDGTDHSEKAHSFEPIQS